MVPSPVCVFESEIGTIISAEPQTTSAPIRSSLLTPSHLPALITQVHPITEHTTMSSAAVAQTASNAYAPVQTGGFTPPGPTAAFLSDINILLSGAALFAAGKSNVH